MLNGIRDFVQEHRGPIAAVAFTGAAFLAVRGCPTMPPNSLGSSDTADSANDTGNSTSPPIQDTQTSTRDRMEEGPLKETLEDYLVVKLPPEGDPWHDDHRFARAVRECVQAPGDMSCNNNFGPATLDCGSTITAGTVPVRIVDGFYDSGDPRLGMYVGQHHVEFPFDPKNIAATEQVLTEMCLSVRRWGSAVDLDRTLICGPDVDSESEACDDYIGRLQSKNWEPEKRTMMNELADGIDALEDFPYEYSMSDSGFLTLSMDNGREVYAHVVPTILNEGTDEEEQVLQYEFHGIGEMTRYSDDWNEVIDYALDQAEKTE